MKIILKQSDGVRPVVKENPRRRIIDVASRRFRADGAAASGLAGVMTEAGLTNGAFYAHFDSKEALVKEAMVNALLQQRENLEHARGEGLDLESIIRDYLSVDHIYDVKANCAPPP